MKTVSALTMSALILGALTASAANLSCKVPPSTTDWSSPQFSMTATVDDSYLDGQELTVVNDIVATVDGQSEQFGFITADPLYHPRTNANRARFLGFSKVAKVDFDGIIHGFLMPKTLTAADIISSNTDGKGSTVIFRTQLLSSTDSYHDGIISYFAMICTVSK